MKKISFVALVLIVLNSCGPISLNRSYLTEMEEREEYMVPGRDFAQVAGDIDQPRISSKQLYERTPDKERVFPGMSEEEKLKAEYGNKLANLTEEQRAWFAQYEMFFTSDSQKIYFLGLSEEEQSQYLANNIQNKKLAQGYRQPASLVTYSPRANRELFLGMDKASVVQTWGNPHRVDVAGNPRLQNERWTFYEAGVRKYIYFASGRVEGWVLE